ncbi:hypothetical protein D3C86_1328320 [compost metagenome]
MVGLEVERYVYQQVAQGGHQHGVVEGVKAILPGDREPIEPVEQERGQEHGDEGIGKHEEGEVLQEHDPLVIGGLTVAMASHVTIGQPVVKGAEDARAEQQEAIQELLSGGARAPARDEMQQSEDPQHDKAGLLVIEGHVGEQKAPHQVLDPPALPVAQIAEQEQEEE